MVSNRRWSKWRENGIAWLEGSNLGGNDDRLSPIAPMFSNILVRSYCWSPIAPMFWHENIVNCDRESSLFADCTNVADETLWIVAGSHRCLPIAPMLQMKDCDLWRGVIADHQLRQCCRVDLRRIIGTTTSYRRNQLSTCVSTIHREELFASQMQPI